MKKLIALLLALMMVFALAACNNNDDPNGDDPLNRDPGTSQGGTQGGENNPGTQGGDLASMIGGMGSSTTIYSQMDEATKQQFIAALEEEGMSVVFGVDGSMTVVDTDGSIIKQNPDGTWAFNNGQGGKGQISTSWPDNEFTKLVPKPNFTVGAAYVEGNTCHVSFSNVTVQELRDYVASLKAAGFNIDEQTEDEEAFGTWVYEFSARNANGDEVEINGVAGTSGLTITSPNASQGGNSSSGGNASSGKAWSTDKAPAWNGSGKIIDAGDLTIAGYTYYHTIYINTGTVEELSAYVSVLKNAGFTYRALNGDTQEPSAGYEEDSYRYRWNGYTSDGVEISVALFKDQQYGVSSAGSYKYYLTITVSAK